MKKNKTIAILSLILVALILTLYKVDNSKNYKEKIGIEKIKKITMVTDVGGINDQSFNQSAWEGLKQAEEENSNLEVRYLESKQEADFIPNIETAIEGENDLIIGVGFALGNAIEEMAKAYPEQQFAIIDYSYENKLDNVMEITFEEEQAGYLVGLVAGKMTKTNKIGFVGGYNTSPAIINFKNGYIMGAKEINKDIEIIEQYANSFVDASKGRAIAQQQILNKVDIIFTASGGVNTGVIETAKENNIKVIGVDADMNYIQPDTIITSALKNVDTATYTVASEISNGKFESKNRHFDLSNNGVGYATTGGLIPTDIIEFVNNKLKK